MANATAACPALKVASPVNLKINVSLAFKTSISYRMDTVSNVQIDSTTVYFAKTKINVIPAYKTGSLPTECVGPVTST